MKSAPTMRIGPLGSTVHVLRADAETIVELAAIDWNRNFPRVRLDPVRGLITLMSPLHLHDDLAEIFGRHRTLRSDAGAASPFVPVRR